MKHSLFAAILGILFASNGFCAPVAVLTPDGNSGASVIHNSDGPFKQLNIQGRNAISTDGGQYLYVRIDPELRKKTGNDVYLVVDFLDDMFGQFHIEYNSTRNNYERGPVTRMFSSGKWERALVHLPDSDFRGTENSGSDLRFVSTDELAISRIEVYSGKPDIKVPSEKEESARIKKNMAALPQNGKPGNGMGYVFGDNSIEVTDPEHRFDTPFGCNRDDTTIKLYKTLGVTSVESYVTWETCEKEGYNKWDWTLWDKQLQVLKANDMKWTPFLILGPAYSTPDWFRASKDHFPCRCLEHGEDSKVESLWNPNLPKWIDRFLGAFAERYGKTGVLENILIGIQGDYGEAIYSVYGGWTEFIPGPYHAHQGYWCNDPYALTSFRKAMQSKYNNIETLNKTWGTDFSSFAGVDFPGRGDALAAFKTDVTAGKPEARRRWLDFIDWYRGCMTDFADMWLAMTKKHFPNTSVYLCTGGSGQPEHGSDFAEQCRVAAKNKCGVRITNEGPGYQWNNVLTRWVASAGRHYGSPFAFEPASNIDVNTIPGRFYNAIISGSSHLHDYSRNIISSQARIDAQRKAFKHFRHISKPIIPIALWYPNVALTLDFGPEFGRFSNGSAKLRDYIDHDYLDETMLRSSALDKYKVLVILDGEVMESKDAAKISAWAERGGIVLVMNVNKFQSVEATDEPEKSLFGENPLGGKIGKGRILRVKDWPAMASALTETMQMLKQPVFDLKEDGLYASRIAPNKLMYLNPTAEPVTTEIVSKGKKSVHVIPPGGITEIDF